MQVVKVNLSSNAPTLTEQLANKFENVEKEFFAISDEILSAIRVLEFYSMLNTREVKERKEKVVNYINEVLIGGGIDGKIELL